MRIVVLYGCRLALSLVGLMLTFLPTSCRVSYSFTGASISANVKTITVPYFPNKSVTVIPTLSRTITDALRDYYTSQTNLVMVDRNGDLQVDGEITGYTVLPVAIQGNETAAMNRLTITVKIRFTNKIEESQSFEEATFSRYLDYQVSQDLTAIQDNLIQGITEQLVQDIFNKTVVNW